ncbi:glycosyltransferase family 4 protein [Novosphingobium aquiterrae]|uniref:Glycosyltransferase family 4 protein n=1 Tax=Novosphingobium aquiterrae TaxID=624388 RepID=A0ABV6PJA4_9SPHN
MADRQRIMIDGFNLALPRGTGVATYGYNLALAAQGMGLKVDGLYGLRAPYSPKLREIVFYEALGGEEATGVKRWQWKGLRELSLLVRPKLARELPSPGTGSVVTEQFAYRLPSFDRLFTSPGLFEMAHRHFRRYGLFMHVRVPNPPAIMHWTYPLPIRLVGAKNIYTLHDLVPLRLPFASLDNKRLYYKLMRACVAKGDHICTVSDASLQDIATAFPRAAGKITNTFQAVRLPKSVLETSEEDVETSVRSIFNLPYKGYFMFFGAVEPKKNVARLIEAYLSLSTNTPLVIVGTRAWGSDVELRLLQKDEIQPFKAMFKNIRRIDYLPRNLLMRLVRGAKAVAFPSLYEGFGLPALEAMMLGTPVITSTTSSLPEVVGDAALKVDPYSVPDIAAALRALDGDGALRANLSAQGKARAQNFTMDRYQQALRGMYDQVLAR